MSRTPVKSIRDGATMVALSSAKKALSGARREVEDAEAVVDALMAIESAEAKTHSIGASPPLTSNLTFYSPDTNDKENCASGSKQFKQASGVAKQGDNLVFDFNKINKAAATPKEAKSPVSNTNLVSKLDGFTKAIKEMNAHGGRTPKKSCKGSGNNSGAKYPMADENFDGLLENVKVGKEVNTEEDIVFEVRAKPFRLDFRYEWIKSMRGNLKLYRNRTTGQTRLVQRNAIGTVKLNIAIGNNMACLEKFHEELTKKGRKPKEVAYVKFVAVAGEDTGVECFLLKVKPEKLHTFYDKLKEMGAEVKGEN